MLSLLAAQLSDYFGQLLEGTEVAYGELTITVALQNLREICFALRDQPNFDFKLLVDICGVDYLHYGVAEWETESATATGFERGVEAKLMANSPSQPARFASVYHLLSLTHNQRIRIRVFLKETELRIPTVVDIWPAANWYEREAFDLFGIIYLGHPDLRRILTDYGFVGHPFRKDFPLIGNLEARYDAQLQRVIYEPVSIKTRVLEPKVIRRDNRYQVGE
jgi:NADH-quinone oxidoreductase subunit C